MSTTTRKPRRSRSIYVSVQHPSREGDTTFGERLIVDRAQQTTRINLVEPGQSKPRLRILLNPTDTHNLIVELQQHLEDIDRAKRGTDE